MNQIATASECGFALIDLTGPSSWPLPPPESLMQRLAADGYLAVLATPALADARPERLPPALPAEMNPATRQADLAGYTLRRRLARALAAAASGVPAELLAISATASGAPILVGRPFYISFSTRAPLSAVVLAPAAIGIDIEQIIPAEAIPWNMLRADETARLKALPHAAQGEAFARLWAAKEAYAKALGLGFQLEPESLLIGPVETTCSAMVPGRAILPPGRVKTIEIRVVGIPPVIIALALLSS